MFFKVWLFINAIFKMALKIPRCLTFSLAVIFFEKVRNKKILFCRSCWEAEALSEEEVEEMDEMLR